MPRRRYLLLEDVAEDLDEEELSVHMAGGGRLQDDELLSFVNVYSPSEFMSHDAHHVAHPTHPELNRTGSQLVWVENAHTGELVPVARRGKKKMSLRMGRGGGRGQETADVDAEAGGDLEAGALESDRLLGTPSMPPPLDVGEMGVGAFQKSLHQQQEDEIAPIVSYRNLVMVQRACFLVVQGMLAGFCFTTLLAVESANGSDTQLLLFYQPTAQDYRRFFYLLSSTSLLGAIDLCLTVYSSKWDSGHIAQQTATPTSVPWWHCAWSTTSQPCCWPYRSQPCTPSYSPPCC
ncbi:hypothetical protein B484DRAFT_182185 [Ochromonadaceae sp. CCMP2298]|nr:hypothetical protein B484DRAFT_182185 [Ochromonadaceae sp. CCMP2298]